MVAKASYFIIYENDEAAGYFIMSKDNELIEFYLKTSSLTRKEEFFAKYEVNIRFLRFIVNHSIIFY